MKKYIVFPMAFIFVMLTMACGENENVTEVPNQPDEKIEKVNPGDTFNVWRSDEARFTEGEFSYTRGEESYSDTYGYADFRYFENLQNSKLTILNYPMKGSFFPFIRITCGTDSKTPEELIGATLTVERFNLKIEKLHRFGLKESGTMTINAISEGFIEGTFSATLDDDSNITGAFRIRLYQME